MEPKQLPEVSPIIPLKITRSSTFSSTASALVNPIDGSACMGAGLALKFKTRYPGNWLECARAAPHKEGAIFRQKLKSITILNVVTKRHWRYKSRLNMIRQILKNLTNVAAIYDLKTVALPVIGAGLGGLPPEKVIDLCKLELPNPFGIEFTLHIWE